MGRVLAPVARRGVALVAVVVALAVVAALAAVAVPVVAGHSQMVAVTETREIFQSLEFSITNAANSPNGAEGFRSVVGNRPPSRLSQLVVPITRSDKRCNGGGFGGGEVNNWPDASPYSGLYIAPGIGVQTPIGTIRDTVLPSSSPKVPNGQIGFVMDSVASDDAQLLDLLVDGTSPPDSANGRLRYDVSPSFASSRIVYYLTPVPGC